MIMRLGGGAGLEFSTELAALIDLINIHYRKKMIRYDGTRPKYTHQEETLKKKTK